MRRTLLAGVLLAALLGLLCWLPLAQAADLSVTWDANTEADLAGYKVFWGTAAGAYGAPVVLGKVTSYRLTGLLSGTTYYVALKAFDTSANESGFSTEVFADTGDQTAPDPPVGLKVARPVSGLGSR